MARLESVARAGYFPTPSRVAASIARHLTAAASGGKRVVRLLDPCAGTGEAAAVLAQALGAESFGIELNEERAIAARNRLDHLLQISAFSVRLANGGFSCLFLNPPYDYDDESRRLEHAFLTSLTRALCPCGVLVYLVPQPRLSVSARYLASHFTDLRAWRFPDPEYAAFRQAVLLAIRRPKPAPDPVAQAEVEAWSRGDLPPLPDAAGGPTAIVPSLPAGDVLFASLAFDPEQAATEAHRRGVWAQSDLVEQRWPPDEQSVRPLMPLRKGHLALLIAAGMLNSCVLVQGDQRILVQGDRRILVKGRTYNELVQVDGDEEDIDIQREVIRTSIAVLDLGTGAIQIVEQDGRVPAGAAEPAA